MGWNLQNWGKKKKIEPGVLNFAVLSYMYLNEKHCTYLLWCAAVRIVVWYCNLSYQYCCCRWVGFVKCFTWNGCTLYSAHTVAVSESCMLCLNPSIVHRKNCELYFKVSAFEVFNFIKTGVYINIYLRSRPPLMFTVYLFKWTVSEDS